MFDPVRADFSDRLARLDSMHQKGMGLEAPGTLGRSHYRTRGIKLPVITPVVTLVLGLYAFKAILYFGNGPALYAERVLTLRQGSFAEQMVAVLMQPDPITRGLAHLMSVF